MRHVCQLRNLLPGVLCGLSACSLPFLGGGEEPVLLVAPPSLPGPAVPSGCASADACEEECELLGADACARAADYYEEGAERPRDSVRAVELWEQACAARSAHGCLELSRSLDWGRGTEPSSERARALLHWACRLQSPAACSELGAAVEAEDPAAARVLYAAACLGNACRAWGRSLFVAGVPRREGEAIQVWERACAVEPADGGSCTELARRRLLGDAVPRQPDVARQLAERACAQRHAEGCELLADLLSGGVGGAQDAERAASLYAQACAHGFGRADACSSLGWAYRQGAGVEASDVEAVRWWRLACDARVPSGSGCDSLGGALEHGIGASASERLALGRYVRACELGDGWGCANAARLSGALDEARARYAALCRAQAETRGVDGVSACEQAGLEPAAAARPAEADAAPAHTTAVGAGDVTRVAPEITVRE